jgi:hypothetical protein
VIDEESGEKEMGEFASIPYFEPTGLAGRQEVISPVFDVAPFGQVVAALKVVATGGTTPELNASIQHSMDMEQWATLVSFTMATASTYEIKSETKPARYVRAKVDTQSGSSDVTVTFSLLGIAREIGS